MEKYRRQLELSDIIAVFTRISSVVSFHRRLDFATTNVACGSFNTLDSFEIATFRMILATGSLCWIFTCCVCISASNISSTFSVLPECRRQERDRQNPHDCMRRKSATHKTNKNMQFEAQNQHKYIVVSMFCCELLLFGNVLVVRILGGGVFYIKTISRGWLGS